MRFGIRDIVDVSLFDLSTNKLVLFLESLKTSSTEIGAETVYARGGRGNPRRIAWDGTKDVNFKCEDCLISPQSFSRLLGSNLVTGAQIVPFTEILVSSGASIQLSSTPYTINPTLYPMGIHSTDDRSTPVQEYTLGSPSNPNEYSITGEVVTLPAGTVDGDMFIVNYYKQSSANNKRMIVTSDQFPMTFKLTGYTLWRSEQDKKDYPCLITIPSAKLLTPITITQSVTGDPTVWPWSFTVLKDFRSNNMVIYDIDDQPIN